MPHEPPPFAPEPVAALRARFDAALRRPYDARTAAALSPAERRAHVFDFKDGIRLVVYRDAEEAPLTAEFSASALPGGAFMAQAAAFGDREDATAFFLQTCVQRFALISGLYLNWRDAVWHDGTPVWHFTPPAVARVARERSN